MPKFRKRPIEVEAIHFDGSVESQQAVCDFAGHWIYVVHRLDGPLRFWLTTPNGSVPLDDGDWLIKAGPGDFYPCKPKMFAAIYEPSEAP